MQKNTFSIVFISKKRKGVHGTVSCLGIPYFKLFFLLSIPIGATVDLMVTRIGPIAPFLVLSDPFGSICDTIKFTVAAQGSKK